MTSRAAIWSILLAACNAGDGSRCRTGEGGDEVMRAPGVSVATVLADPSSYDGQTVQLTGDIVRILDRRTFLLRGHGLLWAPSIPVVVKAGAGTLEEHVRVVGIAHARVTPPLVHDLGDDVARDIVAAAGDSPIVVASSVAEDCTP